ncbi:serine protease inhibitor 42Dd-like [Drosophila rhopaloa]|uniref:Serpin domain-containing protein n=1 Tax=Drosophila rhopaloa TaxID=1041015 RepID=A0ABM5I0T9_DRORH|nr:serine protease inhibitor 42Dd-like [Drosophila rhopaloa]
MASKASILLLLMGPLLVSQTFEQTNFDRIQSQNNSRQLSPSFSYMDRFSGKLFQKIAKSNPGNVVISPFSVHALLGMILAASSGETLRELKQVGEFGKNHTDVALDFQRLIKFTDHLQGVELTTAMRVYYNQRLGGINTRFEEFAKIYYTAGTEPVDMDNGEVTATNINAWVANSTRNKIQNLISSKSITSDVQAILVNAVYFKGRWEKAFSTSATRPAKFSLTDGRTSQVAMMHSKDVYGFADLPELNATALELAYKDSETSMLILLPNKNDVLADLEQKLALPEFDLNRIAPRLRRQKVEVGLPKFRIEFEQDLIKPLKELGLRQMFSPSSQVINLLNQPVRVDQIKQKAYIDVGEGGTEAAAASYVRVKRRMRSDDPIFVANRPFVFAIRTPSSVLFVGHVEDPGLK